MIHYFVNAWGKLGNVLKVPVHPSYKLYICLIVKCLVILLASREESFLTHWDIIIAVKVEEELGMRFGRYVSFAS